MKGETEGERRKRRECRTESKRERKRERKLGTSVRCGGRQVSGCARFTLAFAYGDTSQREEGRERVASLLRMKRNEEEPERRARKKEERGRICPEEKSHQAHYIPALPFLFVAPRA